MAVCRLVYPLGRDRSELPAVEDNVNRLSEIRWNARLEHVTTCPKVKGSIHEIDVFMHGKENDLGRAAHIP